MNLPIYFDYAATTPVDPTVAAKMTNYLTSPANIGNPASTHIYGAIVKEAVELARVQVAELIHAEPAEIIWTSGATESNNLALKGAAQLYKAKGKHIVTLKTEHPSVLDCCQQLEKEGFLVTYLNPQENGVLDVEQLLSALRPDTILVSVMHVNNETGVIQDIQKISEITSARGILCHVDAAQSAGKLPINLKETPIDLMSLSAHKIYGPKGCGALYVRRKPRVRVAAQLHGGGHEQGMRSGTLATHQMVGMGEAFHLARNNMQEDQDKISGWRQQFLNLTQSHQNIYLNSDPRYSIPNIINFRLQGFTAEELIKKLSGFAISKGSACLSKGIEPSYVLRAMGQSKEEAAGAVRVSMGRFTTQQEVDALIGHII